MLYILLTWLLAPVWWPVAQVRGLIQQSPHRILIAEIAGIGDVVCSASLFKALRDKYPDAQIDLLIDPIAQGLAPILPMVNRVHLFAYPEQKGLKGRIKLARIAASYDVAVCLIPSAAQLAAFCWGCVPQRLTILPPRLNNSYKLLAPLMTVHCQHIEGAYFPETQFNLCAQLLDKSNALEKALPVSRNKTTLSLPNDKTWIGLLVSSGRALKRLSDEQLFSISNGILESFPETTGLVLMGGPGDQPQAKIIFAQLEQRGHGENVVNTVGQYELAQLSSILEQLSVFVGVDSGVTHMADAVGVPIVCIAGPVNLSEVYLPAETRQLFKTGLPCHPCSTVFNTPNKCRIGERQCLNQLDCNELLSKVVYLVNNPGN